MHTKRKNAALTMSEQGDWHMTVMTIKKLKPSKKRADRDCSAPFFIDPKKHCWQDF